MAKEQARRRKVNNGGDDDNASLSRILDDDENDDGGGDDDGVDDSTSSGYSIHSSDSDSDSDSDNSDGESGTSSASSVSGGGERRRDGMTSYTSASSAEAMKGTRSRSLILPTNSSNTATSRSSRTGQHQQHQRRRLSSNHENDDGRGGSNADDDTANDSRTDYDDDDDTSATSSHITNDNKKARTPKSILRQLRANDASVSDIRINLKMVTKLDVADLASEISLSENVKKLTLDFERIPIDDVLTITKSIQYNQSITALAVVNARICRRVANELSSFFAKNRTLLGVRLSDCSCVESGLAILFLGLQHSKITTLTIHSTNLGGYASDIVGTSVRLSKHLSYLQLTDVNLELSGLSFLLKNLAAAPLIHLDLSQNKVLSTEEGVDLLVDCLESLSKLERLTLSDCDFITKSSIENICEGLAVHKSLVNVDLSRNAFGDKGGHAIIKMLSSNHDIKTLNLNGCRISKSVTKQIVDAIRYNNSFLKNMFSSEVSLAILDSVNLLETITSSATTTVASATGGGAGSGTGTGSSGNSPAKSTTSNNKSKMERTRRK